MKNGEVDSYIQNYFGSHLDEETKKVQQEYQVMGNSIRKLTVYNKIFSAISGGLYLTGTVSAICGCKGDNPTFLIMGIACFGITNLTASYSSRIHDSIQQLGNRQVSVYTKIRKIEKNKSML